MEEKEALDFIRKFSKISVAKACRYFRIDQSNLVKGRSGRLNEYKVKKFIENEIAELYKTNLDVLKCQEK